MAETERKWTKDQQNAIDARRGTLLVSAAAGSGKTAVLVERVLARLTDPEHPCDADRLLIVTFTKAATSEMRARLSAAVRKRLAADPENENLRKQQMLLPSASICTIDAFCGKLVRDHFNEAGVSPDFRILDSEELEVLSRTAVSTVIEQLYAEDDPFFKQLVELLYAGRDDVSLEDNIISLYRYSRAYPDPQKWLEEAVSDYEPQKDRTASPITKAAVRNVTEMLDYLAEQIDGARSAMELSAEMNGAKGFDALDDDDILCSTLKETLSDYDFEGVIDTAASHAFLKWGTPKGTKDLPEALRGKSVHTLVKDELKKLPGMLCASLDETGRECEETLPVAKKLLEAVFLFRDELDRLKSDRNALDFTDVELKALRLLVKDPAADVPERTKLALDTGEQFEEILIDEYQDTNKAQDMIFTALSRQSSNLFMVGDVKQSIYRFRQAMPEIFLQKKDEYQSYSPEKDEYPATVILGKNFRSRKGILEAVNFTFSQIMSKRLGDITYDQSEKLVYGLPDNGESEQPDVEFHIVQTGETGSKTEEEAIHIAEYIGSAMEESAAWDNPLHYRDFAILLRAAKTAAPVFEQVLTQYGIPVYSDNGGGFLNTSDVQTVLSLLQIIDNPQQDVPLLAVLLSPAFGFTTDDTARLRINSRKGSLYGALLQAETSGDEQAAAFCTTLRLYRRLSVSMPAGELIRRIYEDTSMPDIVSARPNGPQRKANLELLLLYADRYDRANALGIAGFIRYLNRLSDHDLDPGAASTLSPDSDVVRIMTIHKSKGLEFRVCILADMARLFNKTNLNKNLILHPALGIGLKGRDYTTGNTYPTLTHTVIRQETERSELSEAMRILYVGMTRARERLVMVASDASPERTVSRIAGKVDFRAGDIFAIYPYAVRSCKSFYEWMLLCMLRHPAAKPLRDLCGDVQIPLLPADFDLKLVLAEGGNDTAETGKTETAAAVEPNSEQTAALRERIAYQYPYAPLSLTVAKRAASAINAEGFHSEYFASSVPEFEAEQGMSGAQRGTCLHKYMQYINLSAAAEDPEAERDRLVAEDYLTPKEASVIPLERVRKFFRSGIAKRMRESGNLLREQKFAVLMDAGRFDAALPPELSTEKVLVQGIVDCAFEEDGALVVLDYKTDAVSSEEELAERYRAQLLVYSRALRQCLGKPVREAVLYSFRLGKEVTVPLEK